MPSVATAFAHERVGNSGRQAVEDSVVRRTQRTAQIGLAGSPRAEFRQATRSLYQVSRVQRRKFQVQYAYIVLRPASWSFAWGKMIRRVATAKRCHAAQDRAFPSAPLRRTRGRTGGVVGACAVGRGSACRSAGGNGARRWRAGRRQDGALERVDGQGCWQPGRRLESTHRGLARSCRLVRADDDGRRHEAGQGGDACRSALHSENDENRRLRSRRLSRCRITGSGRARPRRPPGHHAGRPAVESEGRAGNRGRNTERRRRWNGRTRVAARGRTWLPGGRGRRGIAARAVGARQRPAEHLPPGDAHHLGGRWRRRKPGRRSASG